jgi:hypothetical protein
MYGIGVKRTWCCRQRVVHGLIYGIPKDKYPSDGGKVEKKLRIGKKYPFYQLIRRQHSYRGI